MFMNVAAESLSLSIANFRAQMLTSLTDSSSVASSSFGDMLFQLQAGSGNFSSVPNLNSTGGGISDMLSAGLDTAPSAPDSGYAMMTKINGLDVTYKAQYSELNQMESSLPQLQAAVQQLGTMASSGGSASIKTQLKNFAQQYNAWIQRFNPDVRQGGLLADTRAAGVSLYELNQTITNPFIGAKDGFHGLVDMGITIDPDTSQMSVDATQLDAALAGNKQGVVDAVGDFSANFAQAANLLASDGNFVRNQLDNLNGAITYIDGNAAALQKEFGSGDAANPTAQVAQALVAYNQISVI
jgi:flagellar capping protein FliD